MTGPWLIAFTLVTLLSLATAVLLLALARHVAILSSRLPQALPLELEEGPDLGTELATLSLASLLSLRQQLNERLMFVLVSPDCDACLSLVADLPLFARDRRDVDVLVVVGGQGSVASRMSRMLSPVESVLDPTRSAAAALGVKTVPFGLMFERGILVAKGIVNSRDMLISLAESDVRHDGDELLDAFKSSGAGQPLDGRVR